MILTYYKYVCIYDKKVKWDFTEQKRSKKSTMGWQTKKQQQTMMSMDARILNLQ